MELIKKVFNGKKKKIIFIIGIVLIIIFGVSAFIVFNNRSNDKKIGMNDKPIVEKIKVESKNEITVIDARIEKLGSVSNIFIKIKNNTNNIIDKSDLKLDIFDKDNKNILTSYINNVDKFEVGEEREVQVVTGYDISSASKYVVEKVEKNS